MAIQLEVPLVGQARGYSCWYAAACMVAYYHEPGPRLGLPSAWQRANKQGITPSELSNLASNEKLSAVPQPQHWSEGSLEAILAIRGPIWTAGGWFGSGHAIVITGVSGNVVHYNDPWGPSQDTMDLGQFNDGLWSDMHGCMMARPR